MKRNTKTVADMGAHLTLVTDALEIDQVLANLGRKFQDYVAGCLFVAVQDGSYSEVWACVAYVPYLTETVYQLR